MGQVNCRPSYLSLVGDELQGDGVYAVSYACRRRAIVEDVAKMGAATTAAHFSPSHHQTCVFMFINIIGVGGFVETRTK